MRRISMAWCSAGEKLALVVWSLAVVCCATVEYRGRKYAYEGDSFNISCVRTAYGVPKWTKDGVVVVPEEDNVTVLVQQLDSKLLEMHLLVASANHVHRGEYKCDSFSSDSHRIEIVSKPETDESWNGPKERLRINETLELYCHNVEDSVFQINWYKDGRRILEGADERIIIDGRHLRIAMATESDSGEYRCAVEVTGLSYPAIDHPSYVIQVTYAARVMKFPNQIRPILGRDFFLECKVRGFPIPRISWFIDGVLAEEFQVNYTRVSLQDNSEGLPNAVLFITNVTYEDGHAVTCVADNREGFAQTSVLLAIRENMINTNEEFPGEGIILNVGSDLVLQCNTTDDPSLNVVWYKNGNTLNMTDPRVHVENFNNTLVIHDTTEGDTGIFMCVVNSEELRNASIAVRTRVRLQQFDSSRNVVQGQDIVLNCNVTQGFPLPDLQWLKDGNSLNLSDPRIVSEENRGILYSKLKIKNADFNDRAEYTCIATNRISSTNTTILVRIKDKYAALWPFLGICAEVAILCTIIFVYEKKRQKPDFEESEADHATENKTLPEQEDKSQDIRQRK